MRYFTLFLSVLILYSCDNDDTKSNTKIFTKVDIAPIKDDSTIVIRALELDKNKNGLFATYDGRVGTILKIPTHNQKQELQYEAFITHTIKEDTIVPHFRAVAHNGKNGFALSIANPALLYKLHGKDSVQLVYREDNQKVFYDAMQFWNEKEGIAIGDPTDGCMSIIVTRDGGATWNKLDCSVLPKSEEGEAAFAASNTNIAIVGNSTWVATGGKVSRVLFSPDKGKTWTVNGNVPIVQGAPSSGIFSMAFYDMQNGFAIGGDYKAPEGNVANKIKTTTGGLSWEVVANGEAPGYRSCVQYVPNSNAKQLVAIGFKGIDYSSDAGKTWVHFSDASFYTLRFVNDSTALAAGKGKIAKLLFQ